MEPNPGFNSRRSWTDVLSPFWPLGPVIRKGGDSKPHITTVLESLGFTKAFFSTAGPRAVWAWRRWLAWTRSCQPSWLDGALLIHPHFDIYLRPLPRSVDGLTHPYLSAQPQWWSPPTSRVGQRLLVGDTKQSSRGWPWWHHAAACEHGWESRFFWLSSWAHWSCSVFPLVREREE